MAWTRFGRTRFGRNRSCRRGEAAAVALVATCALAGVAVTVAGAAGPARTIGHGVRLKGTKIWYVHGTVRAPERLAAAVVASPRQTVKVQWSVVCQKNNPDDPADHIGVGSTSGQSAVQGAGTVRLPLPYAKPPSCVATVYARLARSGGLTLRLVLG